MLADHQRVRFIPAGRTLVDGMPDDVDNCPMVPNGDQEAVSCGMASSTGWSLAVQCFIMWHNDCISYNWSPMLDSLLGGIRMLGVKDRDRWG